jgi:hypothetical protein
LRQDWRAAIDELRHEGDKEGDTLGIERGDDEGMAEDAANLPAVTLRGRIRESRRGAPQADTEINEIGSTDPLEESETSAEAASKAPRPASERVMATKSPAATPRAVATAIRLPWVRA